jgi:hypothetical protein
MTGFIDPFHAPASSLGESDYRRADHQPGGNSVER